MVRRSIFMPQRSRAGTDASAHVGHAPRLLGRRGGIDVIDKEYQANKTKETTLTKENCIREIVKIINRNDESFALKILVRSISLEKVVHK